MNYKLQRLEETKETLKAGFIECVEEFKEDFSKITIEDDLEIFKKYIKSLERIKRIYFETIEEIEEIKK